MHMIRPHVQTVQNPRPESADLDNRTADQFASILRLEQKHLLLHETATISFQSCIGDDQSTLTITTQVVKTTASIARQPDAIASKRDQIHHSEKCGERTFVLISTLDPALTGAAG
jgi:hypothetical protein